MTLRLQLFLALVLSWLTAAAAEISPEQLDFFEARVRPILVEHCYPCHSSQAIRIKGRLRLDSRPGLVQGGESGTALIPGDPEASLLIRAVRYQDKHLRMPPEDKKLASDQINDLVAWIKMGAPDPRDSAGPLPLSDVSTARATHWAFQKLSTPALPPVQNTRWIRTPVDNFILAKLEQRKIKPAPQADRRTLIRRLSYDLTGLPPTPQEVEAFITDRHPDAYAQLVDRLLASPRYGERWGRHWLDVARYADTKGYLAGGEERRYPFSHTYRDYVIAAFNEDKPFDRFLLEQIAADLLPMGTDKSQLAALGFLTLGRRFLNNQNDIIDDRIDVITRGTLGLTVACARCHDHKFDPIPTQDYYSLHGIFASTTEPTELPLLRPLSDTPDYQDYLRERAKIQHEIVEFEDQEIESFLRGLRENVGHYLLASQAARQAEPAQFDTIAGANKTLPTLLRQWMANLEARHQTNDPIFGPWFALSALPDTNFCNAAAAWLASRPGAFAGWNSVVYGALSNSPPRSLQETSEIYTKLFRNIDTEWSHLQGQALKEHQPTPNGLPDLSHETLRQFLYAQGSPANPSQSEVRSLHARRLGEGAAPMRNRIEALNWTHPGAPLRAMALADLPQSHNSHVAKRGNPANPGEEVPRRFLEVLSSAPRHAFTNGSGRLELAEAIVSPDNPLTSRVWVNRVWRYHFGEALVGTTGDFGVRTESPVQRELLDYLASTFVKNGWKIKDLHRLILLSATYQESTEGWAASLQSDPQNNYYSHMNVQRLDFESLRDTLLAASGQLDFKMGGPAVDLISEPFTTRRTVYGLIDRQNLPGLFRTFDFANPDTSNQGRFQTTVPQQALFMMNSPFVIERARNLAQRQEINQARTAATQIQNLYQLLYQRMPRAEEVRLGINFLRSRNSSSSTLRPLEQFAQVLLLSNELLFVD